MADTEFTGVIKLTADTTEAEKKVEEIGDGKKKPKNADSAGKEAEKAARAAATAAEKMKTSILSTIETVFGRVGSSATGAFGRVTGLFSNIGNIAKGSQAAGTASAAASEAGGEVASAAGTAGTAAVAGGPVGIAIGAAVASIAAIVAAGVAIKKMTEQVLAFGRTLAQVSPSMAMAFARFDQQMMLLKQRMGEALAPAIEKLLTAVLELAEGLAPIIVFVVRGLSEMLSVVIDLVGAFIRGQEAVWAFTQALFESANRMSFGIAGEIVDAANPAAVFGGKGPAHSIRELMDAFNKFVAEWKREKSRNNSGMIIKDFMTQINAQGSAQRMYQERFDRMGVGTADNRTIPVPRVGQAVKP